MQLKDKSKINLHSPAMAWAHVVFLLYSMQPCSFLHKVSSSVSCSMGLAVGYGPGYSSSADPMSVDLAVELGGGQT